MVVQLSLLQVALQDLLKYSLSLASEHHDVDNQNRTRSKSLIPGGGQPQRREREHRRVWASRMAFIDFMELRFSSSTHSIEAVKASDKCVIHKWQHANTISYLKSITWNVKVLKCIYVLECGHEIDTTPNQLFASHIWLKTLCLHYDKNKNNLNTRNM